MKAGFVDTNILVYAAACREEEPAKWRLAHATLDSAPHSLSGQVLAEFYSIVTGKYRMPLGEASAWMNHLQGYFCQPVDKDIVLTGVLLSQRYGISYWDGAIIAAAQRVGTDTVYTEDLSHGQSYDGVRVINPLIEN